MYKIAIAGASTLLGRELKEALEEYTTSDMRPKYIYGLERLDYHWKEHLATLDALRYDTAGGPSP